MNRTVLLSITFAFCAFLSTAATLCMDEPFMCKIRTNNSGETAEQLEMRDAIASAYAQQGYYITDPHPNLRLEVERGLEAFGVTDHVYIFESKEHTTTSGQKLRPIENDCAGRVFYDNKSVRLIIIRSIPIGGKPFVSCSFKFDILHECAHIARNHVSHKTVKKTKLITDCSFLLSTALCSYAAIKRLNLNPPLSTTLKFGTIGGLAASGLALLINKLASDYFIKRPQEREADIDAFRELIKQEDLGPLLAKLESCFCQLDGGHRYWKGESGFSHEHPSVFRHAKTILNELKNAGFDLNDLPIHDSFIGNTCLKFSQSKEYIQERITRGIKKYFPAFLE